MTTRRELIAAAAGAGVALAFPGIAGARQAGGGALAVVTADLQSHVVTVDPATGQVLDRIRTASGPRSVEAALGTLAVVAHTTEGKLTIVHPYEPKASVMIGGFKAPRYTAVVNELAHVTDSAAREVVVVDLLTSGVRARTRVPGPARHVSASADGSALWTVLGSKADRIAVLDLENTRPRLVRTIEPPAPAHDVVFAPDGQHVWVTSGAVRKIWVYETAGRRPVAEIHGDAAPQHVTWVGNRAFVASGVSGTVRVHRSDGTQTDLIAVPKGSYNISFGAARIITPSLDRGTIAVLDQRDRVRLIKRVARSAHDACIVTGR